MITWIRWCWVKNRCDFRIARSRVAILGPILLGMVFFVTDLPAMVVKVNPDRNPVRLNESFTLTFTANSSSKGDPDFSALNQDFEVLSQSQNSNISLANGNYSKSVSWTLTLMAKKTGRLLIPAISFGLDHSDPIQIEVLDAINSGLKDDSEIFLEVSAEPENPYVQAQVIYTVKFLRRVDITQASLSEPVLDNAMIQKLGDDRSFSLWRNGYQYAVTERKYAIFPQQSGLLAIPPLEMKADVVTSGRRGFFGRRATRIRRFQSNAIALDIRPIPPEFKGDFWFPAERVALEEHWSNTPPSIAVGEPLTRTLNLIAIGAPLSRLPELGKLQFKGAEANSLKQYPDQPAFDEQKSFSGIVSSREQKTALIPPKPGSFRSDGLEIPWWNTQTDRMEIARLPGVTIKVFTSVSSSGVTPDTMSISGLGNTATSASSSPDIVLSAPSAVEEHNPFWLRVSIVLGIGWAGTLIYLVQKKLVSKSRTIAKESESFVTERRSIGTLKQACRDGDPFQAKDALLAWGGLRWPESPPRSLAMLATLCDAKLGGEIATLNQSLYGRDGGDWGGNSCWEAFSKHVDRVEKNVNKKTVDLEPLYKV